MPLAEKPETSLPHVGVCTECDELFTLPDGTPAGRLGCPHCEAEVAFERLKVRGLRPAVLLADEPEPAPPEPAAALAEPETPSRLPTLGQALGWQASLPEVETAEAGAAETTESTEATAERLATEADALLRSVEQLRGGEAPPQEATPEEPASIAAAPSSTAAVEAAPAEEPASAPTNSLLKEFGFDFSETPLRDEPAPTPDPPHVAARASIDVEVKQPAETSVGDASLAGGDVADLLRTAASDELQASADQLLLSGAEEDRTGRWGGLLSATAGLLLIGAPAAYLVLSGGWGDGPSPTASSNASMAAFDEATIQEAAAAPAPSPLADADTPVADPFPLASPTPPESDSTDRYARGRVEAATYEVDADPEPPAAWAGEPASAKSPRGDRYASADRSANDGPAADEFKLPDPPASFAQPSRTATEPPAPINLQSSGQPEAAAALPIVGAPTYSVDELSTLAAAAITDAATFAGGALNDADQAPALGQAYARLCKLSEALTLVDPALTSAQRREGEFATIDVFQKLLRDAAPRENSRVIARHWIEWTQRPHGGVFFAAKPTDDPRKAGDVYRYEFELDGKLFPVVTSEKLLARRFLAAQAQEVGILGVVVEAPSQRLAGYEGDDARVVWVRKTIPLREPGAL